jgi:hypothetical protein
MLSLLLAATLGQCGSRASYGYARQTYYAAPTYTYQAPAQQYYQQPTQQYYQAPAYNYSLVGDMLRQEAAYQTAAKTEAKLDVLLKLLAERPALPPIQPPAPQPQFQAPYPSAQVPSKAPPEQPQFQYPTAQQPSKAPPAEQFQYPGQPSQQFSGQQWSPSDQPPYGTKPIPSPVLSPSFESSGWVPPPTSGGGYGGYGGYGGVAAMTAVMQNRCSACHVGTSDAGGGIKLLEQDGQLADISPYLDDIGKAVTSGRMPKKGPRLNNQELFAVLSGLREYAAQSRNRQNVVASFGQ